MRAKIRISERNAKENTFFFHCRAEVSSSESSKITRKEGTGPLSSIDYKVFSFGILLAGAFFWQFENVLYLFYCFVGHTVWL